MTESSGRSATSPDVTVSVPDEVDPWGGAGGVPAQRGEFSGPDSGRCRVQRGRSTHRSFEPLPDLAAGLSAVPGGLGVELDASFSFAGVKWMPADALVDGSPIGVCLAAELAHPPGITAVTDTACTTIISP